MIIIVTCTGISDPGASQQLTRGREEGVVVGGPMTPGGRRVTSRAARKPLHSSDSEMTKTSSGGHASKSRPQTLRNGLLNFRESAYTLVVSRSKELKV